MEVDEDEKPCDLHIHRPWMVFTYGVLHVGATPHIIQDPEDDEEIDAIVVLEFKEHEQVRVKVTHPVKKRVEEKVEEEAGRKDKAKFTLSLVTGKINVKVLSDIICRGYDKFNELSEEYFEQIRTAKERFKIKY